MEKKEAGGAAEDLVQRIIHQTVKPIVKKIDEEACYPLAFFEALGHSGLLQSAGRTDQEVLGQGVRLVEETAKTCMTTAFNLWCHMAALTYVRKSENSFLRRSILPKLENGELRGGTGLSNPMKYYAGLERLCLKAERVRGGYTISGQLPSVSNLGPDHWFGIVAAVEEKYRVMALVPCRADHLVLKEKRNYLGLNGSATYACEFRGVFVPDEWVISEEADDFIKEIRPPFLLYQIPLGLGVTEASISSIEKVKGKQGGCNQYLPVQAEDLREELLPLREELYRLSVSAELAEKWPELVKLRLAVVHLTSKAVYASMLHHGGAGYLQASDPSRRLRESLFLVNLTPTVKHLEKLVREAAPLSASARAK
ncbi:acyl-CoA/acyl-ACP dehydrogenase [Brevibacillus composti]|uniref:Acyl-CoA/acyl-ACP dehydrogenase n=1 Tax=Brevibacillus composti TaxID=2796470 RepID=A0A7T5JNN2_9BACL|nr:acyl-CoA dehydrogenase family protein [Brevibacillus composti]QQE74354.1 acyl-CoA/acyl-ACP dehydrogenase [Brevibacillus composti]QUO41436.1 acyl-CoA/acyl-ACP dehydrogenase [Brevibacillus composti]